MVASGSADTTLRASRALLGIVARSVEPALQVVSLAQLRVLVLLSAQGATRVGQLAEGLGANLSTFSRSVDRMVAGGWVVRTGNPSNRREVLLELTDDGARLVRSVTVRRRRAIDAVLRRMSEPERAALVAALEAFNAAAGEPGVEDLLPLGM